MAAATLAAVLGLPGAPIAAQDGPPPPTDTTEAIPLEPLVVRALRAPLSAREAPFAITVRRLDRAAGLALSLDDRLRGIPGLQIDDRHNDALGDRVSIRGFGARAQFGVRGVQIVVDGIPATMPDGQATLNHVDLSSLARAEVLRGPAATAYGNAAGGVILLETLGPPAVELRQDASVSAGSGGLLRFRSSTGGGIGESGWLVTLTRETMDGFRPHAEAESWNLTGRADHGLAGGRLSVGAHGVSYDALNPGSLTPDQFRVDPRLAQPFNVAQRTGEQGRHGQLGVRWERDLGAVRLEAASYAIARSLENPIPPAIIELDRRAGGIHLMLSSGTSGSLTWSVGLEAGLQHDDRANFANEGGERGALTLDQREEVVDAAAFAQLLVPVGERVRGYVGARYDRIRFAADDGFVGPDEPDDSGERTMEAFSPSAGLTILAAPWATLFANVSTAFQTPTTTELVNRPDGAGGFNGSLEPQRTVSYEAGARARVGQRLELELTAYEARVRDALVPFEVPSAPGRQYFRNASGARHRGLEAAVRARLGEAVVVRASYDRIDARFTDYRVEDAVYDGLRVPGVRPWTLDAMVAVSPVDALELQLRQRWTGDLPVDDANETLAPGYAVTDLLLTVDPLPLGRFTAAPYAGVENLFDEAYVASIVPNAFGGRYYEPGPGRRFHVGVRARLSIP